MSHSSSDMEAEKWNQKVDFSTTCQLSDNFRIGILTTLHLFFCAILVIVLLSYIVSTGSINPRCHWEINQ